METLLGIVSLFVLAIGAALILFYIVVHPIWGIIDCAVSPTQSSGAKAVWIVVMFITWGFGSIVYGLISASKLFMTATRLTLGALLAVVVLFFALIALVPTIRDRLPKPLKSQGQATSTAAPAETMPSISAESAGLEPYTALHIVSIGDYRDSVAVARFDASGALSSRILPAVFAASNPPTRLAIDPDEHLFYALSTHDVGTIDATSGKFSLMTIDPSLPELSWPGGIAFDLQRRVLIVAGQLNGYSYDPATKNWAVMPGLANLRLCGLTYFPLRNALYGLVGPGNESIRQMLEMTSDGAILRSIRLSPPIPAGPFGGRGVQFLPCGAKLLVISPAPTDPDKPPPPSRGPDRRYLVDPANGRVALVQ